LSLLLLLLLLLVLLPLLLLLSRAGEKLAVFVSAFPGRRCQVDRCPAVFPELLAVQRLLLVLLLLLLQVVMLLPPCLFSLGLCSARVFSQVLR
jgi:hypothetical protein